MKFQKNSTLFTKLGYSTLLYYTIFQVLMAIVGGVIFRNTETFLIPIFISVFTVAVITLVILFFNVRISSTFFLFTLYTIIILFILVNKNQLSITLLVLFLA
ncbi:MAG: hypothetical protein MI922_14530, partial [Bacteroidales bacterium]|nr:hypothetical protein [Bacteroidales bacterium]